MGRKSAAQTLIQLVHCFHEQRQWSQAELARSLDTEVRTIRVKLTELLAAGFPLERFEERPNVFWKLAKGWAPGGVVVAEEDLPALLRIVARAPKTKARERLLARLLAGGGAKNAGLVTPASLVTHELAAGEEETLEVLDKAVSGGVVVRLQYKSARTGPAERALSVHRIDIGPPARVAAYCHHASELRWFRVDRMTAARLDADLAFEKVPKEETDRFLEASIDGSTEGARL